MPRSKAEIISEMVDAGMSDDEIRASFQKPSAPPPSMMDMAHGADATSLIQQAAPSNLLKLAGVATANAPGIAGTLINSLPGIGNPSQITPSLQNVRQNPGQAVQALKRIALVNSGAPLTQPEVKPALAGQAAGTALEMMTPSLGTEGVKATNPFLAGLKRPSTALPGSFEKAGEALGEAKSASGAGLDSPQVHSILKRLEDPKTSKGLLTEAREWVKNGMNFNISNAKALAYKQALGEAQSEGGTFADVYAKAAKKIEEHIQSKSPELASKLKEMALNYTARGKGNKIPWIGLYLKPEMALAKAATMPVVQNLAGAAANPIITHPGTIAAAADTAINKLNDPPPEVKPMLVGLTTEKALEFLKKAKGNKKKADNLATQAGYDTSRLVDAQ